jgi:hypothetical protein
MEKPPKGEETLQKEDRGLPHVGSVDRLTLDSKY